MPYNIYSLAKDVTEKYELKVRYADVCGYDGHVIFEIFDNNKNVVVSFEYKYIQEDVTKIKDVTLQVLRDAYEMKEKDEYQAFDIQIEFNNILSVVMRTNESYSKTTYNFFKMRQFDAAVFKIRLAAALNAMFQY